MASEILMPKIGLNMREGLLVEWLVEDGQHVRKGTPLFIVETDKVTNEILAEEDGIVKIIQPSGSILPVAGVVGYIYTEDELTKTSETADADIEKAARPFIDAEENSTGLEQTPYRIAATPAARKLARELNIDLSQLSEEFMKLGKITVEDVQAFASQLKTKGVNEVKITPVARNMAKAMGIDVDKIKTNNLEKITKSDIEHVIQEGTAPIADANDSFSMSESRSSTLTGIREIIAERMMAGVHTTAPVTITTEVDATELYEFRNKLHSYSEFYQDINLSYDSIFVKLVSIALSKFPNLNSTFQNGRVFYHKEINIGVALDTPKGLVVPVIKNTTQKTLQEINDEIKTINEQILMGKAAPECLTGGTFTLTNLGMFGIDAFTPIIRVPETAILGIGRIALRPAEYQGNLCLRYRLVLSLSFDHRIVDGAPAARFLKYLSQIIQHPTLTLVEN